MLFGITAVWKRRLFILLVLLAAALAAFLTLVGLLNGENIYKGIKIGQTSVSGLKAADAKVILNDGIREEYSESSFTLRYEEYEWKFGLDEIAYHFLVDEAVDKAYAMGRSGSIFQRIYSAALLAVHGQDIVIGIDYDRNKLIDLLRKIKKELDREPKNAYITYEMGNIKHNREVYGSNLDIDINVNLVENHLEEKIFDNIFLQVDKVQPAILYEQIENIDGEISYFYTRFNSGDRNRSDNIRLACSRLNGKILLPSEQFSMNEALGPRTLENGYKEAPVIYKNELIKGPGGGVCQVTTTLYDTILKAKLEVVERSHHSMPLGYVQPGQDATIAEGSIDFKFRNNFEYPVCLAAEVKGGTIHIRVLGKSSPVKYTVKLNSVVTGEYPAGEDEVLIDDTLQDEEMIVAREPRKGIRVILYRDTYTSDGILVEREKITEDYYKPLNGQIKVNKNYFDKFFTFEESYNE